ncbi:MAG: hypothetical protein ACFFC7_08415 [Candidatus Hermodarchaeota archaeon]
MKIEENTSQVYIIFSAKGLSFYMILVGFLPSIIFGGAVLINPANLEILLNDAFKLLGFLFFSLLFGLMAFAGLWTFFDKTIFVINHVSQELVKVKKGLVSRTEQRFLFDKIQTISFTQSEVTLKLVNDEVIELQKIIIGGYSPHKAIDIRNMAKILAQRMNKEILDASGETERWLHPEALEEHFLDKMIEEHSPFSELMPIFKGKIVVEPERIEISDYAPISVRFIGVGFLFLLMGGIMGLIADILIFIFTRMEMGGEFRLFFIFYLGLAMLPLALIYIIGGLLKPLITLMPSKIYLGSELLGLKRKGKRIELKKLRIVQLGKTYRGKVNVEFVTDDDYYTTNSFLNKKEAEQLKEVILEGLRTLNERLSPL